jgi:phosphinothricin acetyltransferase
VIRNAGAADAGAVAVLWNHYIRDTLVTFNVTEKPEAEVAALIASRQAAGQAFLVAEEGRLVGFATTPSSAAGPAMRGRWSTRCSSRPRRGGGAWGAR